MEIDRFLEKEVMFSIFFAIFVSLFFRLSLYSWLISNFQRNRCVVVQLSLNVQKREYTQAFEIFDKNKDGWISRQELKTIMRSLGQNPTDDDIEEMLLNVNRDNDGQISYEEFMRIICMQIKASGMSFLFFAMYRGC